MKILLKNVWLDVRHSWVLIGVALKADWNIEQGSLILLTTHTQSYHRWWFSDRFWKLTFELQDQLLLYSGAKICDFYQWTEENLTIEGGKNNS